MKIFVTSDTHFRHQLMYRIRGEDFEEKIYKGIFALHNLGYATFIHLGDVAIGSAAHEFEEHGKFLAAINGVGIARSILVRGNHDQRSTAWYLNVGWSWVCEEFRLATFGYDVIFTHEPFQIEMVKKEVNLHGHMHNPDHRAGEFVLSNRHYLVSPELSDYKPESLEKILQKVKL